MEIPLVLDVTLADLLLPETKIKKKMSNICYLGNNEGWVDVIIKKVEI